MGSERESREQRAWHKWPWALGAFALEVLSSTSLANSVREEREKREEYVADAWNGMWRKEWANLKHLQRGSLQRPGNGRKWKQLPFNNKKSIAPWWSGRSGYLSVDEQPRRCGGDLVDKRSEWLHLQGRAHHYKQIALPKICWTTTQPKSTFKRIWIRCGRGSSLAWCTFLSVQVERSALAETPL